MGITFFVVMLLIAMIIGTNLITRVPKTGREGIRSGREIEAIIINTNKVADRAVTLKAVGDGRRFKVKMKPTEAHLWKKGDKIKVLISKEDDKKYRVLFNDYFRENEPELKKYALSMARKDRITRFFAARMVKYTAEDADNFEKTDISSQRVFSFVTLMKMIDIYTIFAIIVAVIIVGAHFIYNFKFKEMLIPILVLFIEVWFISSAVKLCVKIKNEAAKKAQN